MEKAIKALSSKHRKGFSLAGIRKFVSENFLHTTDEVKHRIPSMKKFLRNALETGEVVSVKGTGLTGSFRVPSTSSLHKNAKKILRKVKKPSTKIAKKTQKKKNSEIGPVLKPEKIKNVKRSFSYTM